MQIIWQIFWKFLINQIRIFNFTFRPSSLRCMYSSVCEPHLQSAVLHFLWWIFLCTSAVDVWNTAASIRLKYAESPVYRFYHSFDGFILSPSHFDRIPKIQKKKLKERMREKKTSMNRRTKLASERKTISTVCHLVRWMSASSKRDREHTQSYCRDSWEADLHWAHSDSFQKRFTNQNLIGFNRLPAI